MIKYALTLGLLYISMISLSSAYTFGMLSSDDTALDIQNMEYQHDLTLPMVSFIWDDFAYNHQQELSLLGARLGSDRVYHITLSPVNYTSTQVADGVFDESYEKFFTSIKQTGIKVVFRTMHEMNGGWYPWSSDPASFKQAWMHIHALSREAGLDSSQLLFDFSVNGRDMPVVDGATPHQGARLTTCDKVARIKYGCLTREDYYPGDAYVDMMGVTFYNRGKATSDRQRLTPSQIMDETRFGTRDRLVASGNPIIIDEVGTTSVWYAGRYDRSKSVASYNSNDGQARKNLRLQQLATWAQSKSQIVSLSYFNMDWTDGLTYENQGEADWSVIDPRNNRLYTGYADLYSSSDDKLYKLFATGGLTNQPIVNTRKGRDSGLTVASYTSPQTITSSGTLVTKSTSTRKIFWD